MVHFFSAVPRKPARAQRRSSVRLCLEPLEDRTAPAVIDYTSEWGFSYKQLRVPGTDEHNYYYWRSMFNSNNTYMAGIQERSGHFWVVLYDADTGEWITGLSQVLLNRRTRILEWSAEGEGGSSYP